MMTKEEVTAIEEYCRENNTSCRKRIAEFGISEYNRPERPASRQVEQDIAIVQTGQVTTNLTSNLHITDLTLTLDFNLSRCISSDAYDFFAFNVLSFVNMLLYIYI